jgi:hypothetical protein
MLLAMGGELARHAHDRSRFNSKKHIFQSIENRWQGLTSALSGVFCASLGSLNDKWTVEPLHAFRPDGVLTEGTFQSFSNFDYWFVFYISEHTFECEGVSHKLRYAALPSENVCTENLTPFVKLLPCKTKSGIAQLLNPHRLFDADWHGMSIDITSGHNGTLSLKLTIGAVFDPVRLSTPSLVKGETKSPIFERLWMSQSWSHEQIGRSSPYSIQKLRGHALSLHRVKCMFIQLLAIPMQSRLPPTKNARE